MRVYTFMDNFDSVVHDNRELLLRLFTVYLLCVFFKYSESDFNCCVVIEVVEANKSYVVST